MEIPRDLGGHARPNRPRPAAQRNTVSTSPSGESSGPGMPPPVPVTAQSLPLSVLSQVTPRARPPGLVAEEGYGAALGIVRD
ncbi:hypothetical protein [Alloyangia pacifica]|uniref:Uncharacterized protein n=1 Tax=Alloyangia pacifica TaxID=311180 RepID=A0A1I6PCZ1_9RHOB|nr:hypothetical protein [Alloyangia pacifica]SDG24847.1 hypothetical protein SAMN04488245_102153 [Alloyangia pacifica]SFS38056.1 hypothetical protein SAMN04488050_101454 [Alloyangia pacifica]